MKDETDADVARLFAALEHDAPPEGAEAAILARLEAPRPPSPWLFRGGIVMTAVVGIAIATRLAPHAPAAVALPTPVAEPAAPPPREEAAPPTFAVEDLPTAPPPSHAAAPVIAAPKDSFREQLALVESARHSLAQGDGEACLATLGRYDAKYPTGLFTTEVRLVRIDALVSVGQKDRAETIARELLASDPQGAYADRLHSLFPGIGP